MTRMHADELEIDEALVRALLIEQFQVWADFPLERVESGGNGERDLPSRRRVGSAFAAL
jgi:hypothetical protein